MLLLQQQAQPGFTIWQLHETLAILPFPQILFIGCVTLPPPSYTGATTSADSPDAMRICASFWVTNTDVSVILEGNGICVCVCVCVGGGELKIFPARTFMRTNMNFLVLYSKNLQASDSQPSQLLHSLSL